MLDRETIAVASETNTKHINALCGKNVEFLKVKPRCTVHMVTSTLKG